MEPIKIVCTRRHLTVLTFIAHVLNHLDESAQGPSEASLFFFFLLLPAVYENVYNDRILLWYYTKSGLCVHNCSRETPIIYSLRYQVG